MQKYASDNKNSINLCLIFGMNPGFLQVPLKDETFSIPANEPSRPYDSVSRPAETNLCSFQFSLATQLYVCVKNNIIKQLSKLNKIMRRSLIILI